MKKKIIVPFIVTILILTGVFSLSISIKKFFFTTKYYAIPIEAYNADATYDLNYGDTAAKEEIGLVVLDEETCLFIGTLDDENCFVVCEMMKNNDKYAYKGNSFIYDLRERSDGDNFNSTYTSNGYVNWSVAYHKDEIKTFDVENVESFLLANGKSIYLAIYRS